tara:strand:- start:5131 stop:6285 length:1155 start_codon:yes stop_codon:yes gene_type:complete
LARSLYIHWPFCLAKCPYCDFNSHVREQIDIGAWEAALLADMRAEHSTRKDSGSLESIFFGGGTPSLMPPALVAALLREAESLWGFAPDIEITLEGNPSSVEASNFADLALAGINRVSLGVQSLRPEALQFLGRLHGVEEALAAVETAQKHFNRVSIDLIYARPEQSAEEWQQELAEALALGTSHLSLYQLTIEPATRFATDVRLGKFDPLDDDPAGDLFTLTREITEAAGIPAYEISNHSRPGEESRHNLTYWRYLDYHGIGPGAHGRRNGVATTRHKKPENFLTSVAAQGDGIAEHRILTNHDMASEALLMGLRLREGIDPSKLGARFGFDASGMIDRKKFAFYRDLGLLWDNDGRIGVTGLGMPLLDALLGELVSDELVSS